MSKVLAAVILILAAVGAIEIFSLILHKYRTRAKITAISVLPLKGHTDNIEYILRVLQSELCWLKNGCGRLVVLNLGLDAETEKAIGKMQGVELLKKEELYPLLEEI